MLINEDVHDKIISTCSNLEHVQSLSDHELIKLYEDAENLRMFFSRMQLVTKELCNSVYGGFGTNSLRYFNQGVAADITAEGRWACQLMERTSQQYFKTIWPTDYEWHAKLKAEFPEMWKQEPVPVHKDIIVTCDTDSLIYNSSLHTFSQGKLTIEELFNQSTIDYVEENGTEHAKTDEKILNWSQSKNLHYAKPISVIRHKVTKHKWELKTKSGKSVIITGDHSLIIFRNGIKISIKPKDVLLTDKILSVND